MIDRRDYLVCAVVTQRLKQNTACRPAFAGTDGREALHAIEGTPVAQAFSVNSLVNTRWAGTTA